MHKMKYLQCKCSAKSNSVEVEVVNGHKTLEARLLTLSPTNSRHWLSLTFNHDEYLFLVLNINHEYYTLVQTRRPWLLLLTLRVMRNFSQEVPPHQSLLPPCLPLFLFLSPPSLYPSNPSSFSFAPLDHQEACSHVSLRWKDYTAKSTQRHTRTNMVIMF